MAEPAFATPSVERTPADPGKPYLTKLAAALDAAARGFRVFPVWRDSKSPWRAGWQEAATVDVTQIEAWWSENPTWNIGVATGEGLLVVDVDVKDGKQGAESLAMLEMMGLPETMRVRTPTGGVHVYLATDRRRSGRAGNIKDLPGLDTRGDGNLVLWPGSYIGRHKYELIDDRPIAPGPSWLLDAVETTTSRKVDRIENYDVTPDLPQNVERAVDYLKTRAPEAVQGAGGDQKTFEVASEMRALGISEGTAFELMLEHWNEQKASPPWMPDDLLIKVSNGQSYGQGSFGGKTAAGEFGILHLDIDEQSEEITATILAAAKRAEAASSPVKRKFFTVSLAESFERALTSSAKPLIDGLLDQGTLADMYGKPNCGKSFVALDMAACIATGRPWNDRETDAGLVVYIAAEGGAGIHRRVRALVAEKNIPSDAPFALAPCSVDLYAPDADLRTIISHVAELATRHGIPPKMIVVDTLARVLGAGDENSGKDMGQLLANLDRLREATGATVLVIHHSGKDASKGSRGHSSLLGAVDTEIEIVDRKIRTTKQRDHEALQPEIRFELRSVVLGQDARGRSVTSCVVRYLGADEFGPLPLAPAADRMRASFATASAASVDGEVTWDEWLAAHFRAVDPAWREGEPEPRGCSSANIRKLRNEVIESGHVIRIAENRYALVAAD